MYADTNTSPYRELFALAQHTALFTNGPGNWWYISNIASHRLTPWTFLTSGGGKPCSFPKKKQSKHSAPLLCSTRIHIAAAAARFTAWMLFCFHCAPGPRRSQGVSLQIHTGKEEHFILGEKEKARSCPWGTPLHRRHIWSVGFSSALRALRFTEKSTIQGNNSYNEVSPEGFWVLNKGACW